MSVKEEFYQAIKRDNGCLNEIELGVTLGLDEDSTRKLISMLLSEYKIEYSTNRACNYKVVKSKKQTL